MYFLVVFVFCCNALEATTSVRAYTKEIYNYFLFDVVTG